MTGDKADPETEAMLAGAEIEKGAEDEQDVQDTPRTRPADRPTTSVEDDRTTLSTDSEAQHEDSVINPETT